MTGRRVLLFPAVLLAGLAAVWAPAEPPPPDGESVDALVARLGDRSYAEREKAGAALVARGEAALPAVRAAADRSPNPEVRWRASRVWNRILHAARVSKATGLELAVVLPGEFTMGSPPGEAGRRPEEARHAVRLAHRFLLGVYEVTQAEYQAATDGNPSWFAPDGGGKDKIAGQKTGKFPVESVSWFDAVAFCNALSKKDGFEPYYAVADVKRENGSIVSAVVSRAGGNGYRLPTEAEWEYACRAGTDTAFAFGNTARGGEGNFKSFTFGGYGGREERPSKGRTTTVGESKPNRWGLYDLHGNAAEWCADWYAADYDEKAADDPVGPKAGTHKVARGGSWLVTDASCRSASRHPLVPSERSNALGFRVARTP